ncbi:PQQ-dependent sugar dehydrogenase [Tsuneonella sp. HG222]
MRLIAAAALVAALLATPVSAQTNPPAAAARPAAPPPAMPQPAALGRGPWDYETQAGKVHVEVVARQIERPWSLAFLPNGDMLVTERPGRLRVIRNGKLDPVAIAGLPPINPAGIGGLFDIALAPDFAASRKLYISYVKPDPQNTDQTTLAVLSATWDGGLELKDVKDIFVADAWYGAQPWPARCCGQGPATGSHGGRILFGPDGKLYISSGDRNYGEMVQKPDNHFGKILRLNPDGSVPADNPFVGKAGWKPEIWTLGHRNPLGLALDARGRIWETEFGPRGGDELNLIARGANYGWIDVTQGKHYNNEAAKGVSQVAGMTDPVINYAFAEGPASLNPGNPAWYGGPMFPGWRGNLLLPSFTRGLLRIDFDEDGKPGATEELLTDIKQRLRDARVAPDGSVYLLTDETAGAVLRVTAGG